MAAGLKELMETMETELGDDAPQTKPKAPPPTKKKAPPPIQRKSKEPSGTTADISSPDTASPSPKKSAPPPIKPKSRSDGIASPVGSTPGSPSTPQKAPLPLKRSVNADTSIMDGEAPAVNGEDVNVKKNEETAVSSQESTAVRKPPPTMKRAPSVQGKKPPLAKPIPPKQEPIEEVKEDEASADPAPASGCEDTSSVDATIPGDPIQEVGLVLDVPGVYEDMPAGGLAGAQPDSQPKPPPKPTTAPPRPVASKSTPPKPAPPKVSAVAPPKPTASPPKPTAAPPRPTPPTRAPVSESDAGSPSSAAPAVKEFVDVGVIPTVPAAYEVVEVGVVNVPQGVYDGAAESEGVYADPATEVADSDEPAPTPSAKPTPAVPEDTSSDAVGVIVEAEGMYEGAPSGTEEVGVILAPQGMYEETPATTADTPPPARPPKRPPPSVVSSEKVGDGAPAENDAECTTEEELPSIPKRSSKPSSAEPIVSKPLVGGVSEEEGVYDAPSPPQSAPKRPPKPPSATVGLVTQADGVYEVSPDGNVPDAQGVYEIPVPVSGDDDIYETPHNNDDEVAKPQLDDDKSESDGSADGYEEMERGGYGSPQKSAPDEEASENTKFRPARPPKSPQPVRPTPPKPVPPKLPPEVPPDEDAEEMVITMDEEYEVVDRTASGGEKKPPLPSRPANRPLPPGGATSDAAAGSPKPPKVTPFAESRSASVKTSPSDEAMYGDPDEQPLTSDAQKGGTKKGKKGGVLGKIGGKLFRPKSKLITAGETADAKSPEAELTNEERLEILMKVAANLSGGTMSVDEAIAEVAAKEAAKKGAPQTGDVPAKRGSSESTISEADVAAETTDGRQSPTLETASSKETLPDQTMTSAEVNATTEKPPSPTPAKAAPTRPKNAAQTERPPSLLSNEERLAVLMKAKDLGNTPEEIYAAVKEELGSAESRAREDAEVAAVSKEAASAVSAHVDDAEEPSDAKTVAESGNETQEETQEIVLAEFDELTSTAPALKHLTSARARPKAGGKRLPTRAGIRAKREEGTKLFGDIGGESSTDDPSPAPAPRPQPRTARPRPTVRSPPNPSTATAVPAPKPRPTVRKSEQKEVGKSEANPDQPTPRPKPSIPPAKPTPPSKPSLGAKPAMPPKPSGGKPVLPSKPKTVEVEELPEASTDGDDNATDKATAAAGAAAPVAPKRPAKSPDADEGDTRTPPPRPVPARVSKSKETPTDAPQPEPKPVPTRPDKPAVPDAGHSTDSSDTKVDEAGDENGSVPARARQPLTQPAQDDLRRTVRAALRERDIELWVAPYSDDKGRCTVPKLLVDELAIEVMKRHDLNVKGTVVFGEGDEQVYVHPEDVLVAVEKLRLSARKKLKMLLPTDDSPTYAELG